MNGIPWILVAIILGIVVLAIGMVVAVRRRKEPRRTDYRNLFVMGVIWIAFAPVMILLPWILYRGEPSFFFSVFLAMGLAYMIIGLRNRDKWGKKVEVSPTASRNMMIVIVVLVLILVLGIVIFELLR